MRTSILSAVRPDPIFKKVAKTTLSSSTGEWNSEILESFLKSVNYIPSNFGVQIAISSIDENKGYGKGSIIVSNGGKYINIPVIVKDFELSPFDVLVSNNTYFPLSENTLLEKLSYSGIGTVEAGKPNVSSEIKSPGGAKSREAVSMDSTQPFRQQPNLEKMSHLASKESIEKLARNLQLDPDMSARFKDNTGDTVSNIINAVRFDYETARNERKGSIDISDVVDAKDIVAVIDTQMFDVNKLVPINPSSVCEIRINQYPKMEDFLASSVEKVTALKNGVPVVGVVFDVDDGSEWSSDRRYRGGDPVDDGKKTTQRRNQVFFSLDGNHYSFFSDYDRNGIGFYGTQINTLGENGVEGAVKMIASNTMSDFSNFGRNTNNSGYDKEFSKRTHDSCCLVSGDEGLYFIYGAGNLFQARAFTGNFRRKKFDNVWIYTNSEDAIIPSGVSSIQLVKSTSNPIYKMMVGNARNIYLVPESGVFVSTKFMSRLNDKDIMIPSLSVQKIFHDAKISSVNVGVGESGYNISGSSVAPISTTEKLSNLSMDDALSALRLMGVSKNQSTEILKTAVDKAHLGMGDVEVFGVRGDYINDRHTPKMEKSATIKDLYNQIAKSLRVDLVKEASVIDDPEAVDVVLSLDFINGDNINSFIDMIPKMEETISKLCMLLIASRMGLKDMDEGAISNAIKGVTSVVDGLKNLKLSVTTI